MSTAEVLPLFDAGDLDVAESPEFHRSRWPVAPVRRLLRAAGISDNELKRRDIHVKWSRGRLTTPLADTLAVTVLKMHPMEIWPDWCDEVDCG